VLSKRKPPFTLIEEDNVMRCETKLLSLICCAILSLSVSLSSEARELQGRMGLGYNSQFVNSSELERVPAVSLKYGLSRELATELLLGFSTTTPTNRVTGIKIFKNIFFETQLNFYGFLGAGLLSARGNSGFQCMGGFGAEFFIPGVESLGFAMETGGSMDTLSGSLAVRTMGASFLDAGIHFYF